MLRLFPAALAIAATTAIASPALAQDQGFNISPDALKVYFVQRIGRRPRA